MDTLPPYVVYQILKRSTFEDRLLTLRCVNNDWRRWAPLDDLTTLKVSNFERLRVDPGQWRRSTTSADYFQSNQKWLERLLENLIPRVASNLTTIHFDSAWPRVNDTPPLFCAPEGFKRWSLTRPMLTLIQEHCSKKLKELKLTEENFVYTELDPQAYELLTEEKFPKLHRLAVARVESNFGPYLRQLRLTNLQISGEQAPLDTADPEQLKSLQLSHPLPDLYQNHSSFFLSRNFPNLENHREQLLVEFDQLSETAQRKRLADYRQLPNFKRFRVELGPDNGVRTELSSISGYGLPKVEGAVNLQVKQSGDLANNARFLSQLRHVRIEGLLNYQDAQALFCSFPNLEYLTLACHWISDEQHEQRPILEEDLKEKSKFELPKLRNFRLTLWDRAPKWLRSILKSVFATTKSLRSFRLQDFGGDDNQSEITFFEDIGLKQVHENLRHLNCRIGGTKTCEDHLSSLLENRWPKLSTITWHAARLRFDHRLVSKFVESFPNLKRFVLVPPSGPLRPLLPSADADDGLCQFEHKALDLLLSSLSKLREVRLFATTIVDVELFRAISAHRNLKTIKLWDGLLISGSTSLESILKNFDHSEKSIESNDRVRKPLFVEIFTLRSSDRSKISEQGHQLKQGSVFFLANSRSNAIDEQSFYFP